MESMDVVERMRSLMHTDDHLYGVVLSDIRQLVGTIDRLRQDLNTAIERAAQRASEHAVFIERDKNEIALNIASSIRSLKEESSND
jgi:hypothetical protein